MSEWKISQNLKLFISDERVEGYRKYAYNDSKRLLTIGIGHKLTKDELNTGCILINNHSVQWKNGLTDQQVTSLFYQDLQNVENILNDEYGDYLQEQYQFDSLVSFIFNIGINAFRTSSLAICLEQNQLEEVPNQLKRWNKYTVNGKKKISKGLTNRRTREIALWEHGIYNIDDIDEMG